MTSSVDKILLQQVVVDDPVARLDAIFNGAQSYDYRERMGRVEQVAKRLLSEARAAPEKTAAFFTKEVNMYGQLPDHLVPIYNAARVVFPLGKEPEYEPDPGVVSVYSACPLEEALAFGQDPIFGYQVAHGDHSEAVLAENIDEFIKQRDPSEAAANLKRLHSRSPDYAKRFLETQMKNYQLLMSNPEVSPVKALIAFSKYIETYEIFCARNEGAPRGLFEPRHYRKELVRTLHAISGEPNSIRVMHAMTAKNRELQQRIEAATPVELVALKAEVATLRNNITQVMNLLARSKDVEKELVYKNEALAAGGIENIFMVQEAGTLSSIFVIDRLHVSIEEKLEIPQLPPVPRPRAKPNRERKSRVISRVQGALETRKARRSIVSTVASWRTIPDVLKMLFFKQGVS